MPAKIENVTCRQQSTNSLLQQASHSHKKVDTTTLQAHDSEFTTVVTVPMRAVHHLPANHKEIARLILCRKYDAKDPRSCPMGPHCKFVHVDQEDAEAVIETIHVNYAYRSLEEVQHARLPVGETLAVLAPNNRAPCQFVPSEMVLKTKGSLQRHNNHKSKQPLSHCAHFYYNRMCNRGDRCGFIHGVYIDETAGDGQKAPPRAGSSGSVTTNTPRPESVMPAGDVQKIGSPAPAALPALHVLPEEHEAPLQHSRHGDGGRVTHTNSGGMHAAKMSASSMAFSEASSNDLSATPRSDSPAFNSTSYCFTQSLSCHAVGYRRNPYSLVAVTVPVELLS